MDFRPQAWGRPRDDVYGPYNASHLAPVISPRQAAGANMVTGTSILGLKFSDGVVLAADNLASYGSLARFNNVKRLRNYADTALIGFGGDVADMQSLDRMIMDNIIYEAYETNDIARPTFNAANMHHDMKRHLYAARSAFKPKYTQMLVAGMDDDGNPFLGYTNILGTAFTSPSLATGFGAHLAQPIMRKYAPDEEATSKLSREQAMEIIKDCMKVLFYRDARSLDTYSIAVITKDGVDLHEDQKLENQSWDFAEIIKGYGAQMA